MRYSPNSDGSETTRGPKDKEERQHSRTEEMIGQSSAIGEVSREGHMNIYLGEDKSGRVMCSFYTLVNKTLSWLSGT